MSFAYLFIDKHTWVRLRIIAGLTALAILFVLF